MRAVSIIVVDLAKQALQLHGATAEGEVVFCKKLSRKTFLAGRVPVDGVGAQPKIKLSDYS
jgi:hypothetical protein